MEWSRGVIGLLRDDLLLTFWLTQQGRNVVCWSSSSKEFDALLIFASKHLGLASLDKDIQRSLQNLGIHTMELCIYETGISLSARRDLICEPSKVEK